AKASLPCTACSRRKQQRERAAASAASRLTVLGAAAASAMALAYALETRHRAFIMLFAIACACSSIYGFLIGSVPFGAVEALWSVIALQRFSAASDQRVRTNDRARLARRRSLQRR